jgi:hypothetical protein
VAGSCTRRIPISTSQPPAALHEHGSMRSVSILFLLPSVVAPATFHALAEIHHFYDYHDQGMSTFSQTSKINGPSLETTPANSLHTAIRILCQNNIRGGGGKSPAAAAKPQEGKNRSKPKKQTLEKSAAKNKKFHIDFRERKVQIGLLASILFCYPIITM